MSRRENEAYMDGFAAAASIYTATFSERTGELMAKMKSAPGLTKQEQFLLASLAEITSAAETNLREHLNGTTEDDPAV